MYVFCIKLMCSQIAAFIYILHSVYFKSFIEVPLLKSQKLEKYVSIQTFSYFFCK